MQGPFEFKVRPINMDGVVCGVNRYGIFLAVYGVFLVYFIKKALHYALLFPFPTTPKDLKKIDYLRLTRNNQSTGVCDGGQNKF